MRFANFELARPHGDIELLGLGRRWDLHNCADFAGFSFDPQANELILSWRVLPGYSNPWGDPENLAPGCRLRFTAVRSLVVSARDPEIPEIPGADFVTLESIAKAIPGEADYPFKDVWRPEDPFNLRLAFMDGRTIEIDASEATLEVAGQTGAV